MADNAEIKKFLQEIRKEQDKRLATQSSAGLMSAADKKKLDNFQADFDNGTLSIFSSKKILSFASGTFLGTVPATVDGGIWYEVENSEPVVKIYYGDHSFSLTPTIVPISPQLTLSQSTVTGNPSASFVVDVSYLGNGTISISQNNNIGSATYNSSTKKISISPEENGIIAGVVGTTVFTINLSATHGYNAASATLTATWQSEESIGEPFAYDYNGESYSGSQEFPVPGEEVILTFTNAPPDIQISAVDVEDNTFEDFTFESERGTLIFMCEAPLTFTFAADGYETATITFVLEE